MNQPSSACSSLIRANPSPIQVDHPGPCNIPVLAVESPLAYPRSPHHSGSFDDFDQMSEHFDRYSNEPELSLPLSELYLNPDVAANVEYHLCAPQTFHGGRTFMRDFFSDKYGSLHRQNLFYPFASQVDWQLGSWLLRSGLSMAAIDGFLSLDLISIHFFAALGISLLGQQVKTLPISFRSARQLRLLAEMLPSGPCWMSLSICPVVATKRPVTLYYRNPIGCLQALLSHPLFERHISFVP